MPVKEWSAYKWTPQELRLLEELNPTNKSVQEWWMASTDKGNIRKVLKIRVDADNFLKSLKAKGRITGKELGELLGMELREGRSIPPKVSHALQKGSGGYSLYAALKPEIVEKALDPNVKGSSRFYTFKKPTAEQIKQLKLFHRGAGYTTPPLQPKTAKAIKSLMKDKSFLNFIRTWKKGDSVPDNIIKKIFSVDAKYTPNTLLKLSGVLDGSIPLEGVGIDKRLSKKIKDNIKFKAGGTSGAIRGSWHAAARNIAVREFDKIFNPENIGGKGMVSRQRRIKDLFNKYGLKGLSVDEVMAMRSGYTAGQSPYSIFTQILEKDQNTKLKVQVDAQVSRNAIKLNEAIKANDWDLADKIKSDHRAYIKDFRAKHPSFEKVRLPEFSFKDPETVLGSRRFTSLPEEAQLAMKESFKKTKWTPELGANLKTAKEVLAEMKNSLKGLSKKEQLKFCSLLSRGGLPGNCAAAIDANPVKTAEVFAGSEATTGAMAKVKNASTRFLSLLGRGGVRAAPYAAIAAVGAAAEPLVKQFRNDDPTTYMTDPDQQKGVLLSLVEAETPQVDEEILNWQYPGMVAGAAAAIPGSSAVYKARRKPFKTRAAMGPARAALGPVGKFLAGSFSPLAVAASLPVHIGAQVKGGAELEDIATDPFNWMGPAFASTGAKIATRGMPKTGILSKALRMGMSPGALRVLSRGGIYGLLASAGLKGYDIWQDSKYK
jgi:hypothetical protein